MVGAESLLRVLHAPRCGWSDLTGRTLCLIAQLPRSRLSRFQRLEVLDDLDHQRPRAKTQVNSAWEREAER